MPRCKQKKIKLFYNRLKFVKETQSNAVKTQNGESNYVDQKFFFNFYQELPTSTKPWDRHPKAIELPSCLVYVLCDFKAT